jgi:hypothetical protein
MQSPQALAELKKMLSDLPKRTRNTRPAAGVMLPRPGGDMVGEEDEQEEESRS